MSAVSLRNVVKRYQESTEAVRDFNLEIKDKEFIVLVGPSGCGKSTVLRMIAGLEEITEGNVLFDNQRGNDLAPKDRNVAMVFQNYALYPHMNVFQNLAFCLKLKKMPRQEIEKRVLATARILGIEDLLGRKPKALSGGQKQRVALGRAIVREPDIFLMDEPLSNLDAKLRSQTRSEIIKLHRNLQTTFIYVTHDQTEAMTMGDRIVVMKNGLIQQTGSPREVYEYPSNQFVAGFIGSPQMNFLSALVDISQNENCHLVIGPMCIPLNRHQSQELKEQGYINKEIILGIRPEAISIGPSNNGTGINVTIERSETLGAETLLYFYLQGMEVVARVYKEYASPVNKSVLMTINSHKLHLFDKESEIRIIT